MLEQTIILLFIFFNIFIIFVAVILEFDKYKIELLIK